MRLLSVGFLDGLPDMLFSFGNHGVSDGCYHIKRSAGGKLLLFRTVEVKHGNKRQQQAARDDHGKLIAVVGCQGAAKDGANDAAELLRGIRVAKDLSSVGWISALRQHGVDCRKDSGKGDAAHKAPDRKLRKILRDGLDDPKNA